jgi:hypothetical protein
MKYPEPAPEGNWDGYGVLQAKFRSRPLGTEIDTSWFLAQAKAELTTWANPKSKRARAREIPRYVLFATNVVLSPVAEVGGIDTVKREIDALIAKLKLPIRGWRVWHYDQLNTLLDNYPAVRQPYEALTTSGDVLAHLRRILEESGPIEIAERATTYSVMQLKADRHVRLHQAGDTPGLPALSRNLRTVGTPHHDRPAAIPAEPSSAGRVPNTAGRCFAAIKTIVLAQSCHPESAPHGDG